MVTITIDGERYAMPSTAREVSVSGGVITIDGKGVNVDVLGRRLMTSLERIKAHFAALDNECSATDACRCPRHLAARAGR
jgi:hypothetical protein